MPSGFWRGKRITKLYAPKGVRLPGRLDFVMATISSKLGCGSAERMGGEILSGHSMYSA
jgi:hypothetical protein